MADIIIPYCTIVALDPSSFSYQVCATCEQILPKTNLSNGKNAVPCLDPCNRCRLQLRNHNIPTTKHLYRLLISIATEDSVMVVVAFDRAAQTLMGCPAKEFSHFLACHDFAVESAGKLLEGEMCAMDLRPPKGGYAQHLRAVSITPLSCSFQPVMAILPRLYASGVEGVSTGRNP